MSQLEGEDLGLEMRLAFYFPCCVVRSLEFYFLNTRRKFSFYSLFCVGFILLLVVFTALQLFKSVLRNAGLMCSADNIANEIKIEVSNNH